MIFSKDSDIKPYIYSKDSIDRYYENKVLDQTRRYFAISLQEKIIGEIQIKYIDFDKKCGTLSVVLVCAECRKLGILDEQMNWSE